MSNFYVKGRDNEYYPVVFDSCDEKPNGLQIFIFKIIADKTYRDIFLEDSRFPAIVEVKVMNGKKVDGENLYAGPPNQFSINYIEKRHEREEREKEDRERYEKEREEKNFKESITQILKIDKTFIGKNSKNIFYIKRDDKYIEVEFVGSNNFPQLVFKRKDGKLFPLNSFISTEPLYGLDPNGVESFMINYKGDIYDDMRGEYIWDGTILDQILYMKKP
jgi:hypothetical protein